MKIKTNELNGPALDWAVAHVERKFNQGPWEDFRLIDGKIHLRYCGAVLNAAYDPSTDWAQAGPIIEREGIAIIKQTADRWVAEVSLGCSDPFHARQHGTTPLITAMRCFVASKLGDEVDIPDEFVHQADSSAEDGSNPVEQAEPAPAP
jgi:Protein of unknown function (DUF2591)